MGVAALIVYVSLGRRRIDYRFILVGAILPDLIDGVLGLAIFTGRPGRWIAHSMLAVVVIAIVILLAFKGERRLAVFGLAVGWFLHLVGDAMWEAPETFLWPAFGSEFATAPHEPYSWDLVTDPLAHLSTWAGELVGIAVLVWFWIAFRLGADDRFKLWLKDGYLRP